MAKRFIACITVLLLVFPALFVFAAPGEDEVPKVTAVRGSAMIYKSGGYKSVAVYRGMEIGSGDVIRTDVRSSITVSFNQKEMVIGECTQVSLNAMWNRHDRDVTSIVLTEGMLKNKIDMDLDKNSKNEIRTSNTVAGVRGTEYVLVYSRMGLEDGGDENPYTRLKVIDGNVRLDMSGDDNSDSFLVGIDGAKKVTDSINGNQNLTELKKPVENLDVPLEALDAQILENLRNDERARERLGDIDSALEQRQAQDAERQQEVPQRPEDGMIAGSEAPAVIPTLPPPVNTDNPVQAQPESSAPAASQAPESSASSAAPSSSSASESSSSTASSSSSSAPSSSQAPESSSSAPESSSGGSSSGSSGGNTPAPTPETAILYIEDISGDAATAIINKLNSVTSTVTLTSRGGGSLSISNILAIPSGKTLIIDGITLNLSSTVLRAEGKLINRGTINCDTLINRNGDSVNEVSGVINSGTLTISGGGKLTNKGIISTGIFRNDYAVFRNDGTLTTQSGVNTGTLDNYGSIISSEMIATITNGTYQSVINQRSGSFKVNDDYVITGMSVGDSDYECGKIVYSGGSISSDNKLADCAETSHGHLSGITQ